MKRRDVLKKLRAQARVAGLNYSVYELRNHTGLRVGQTVSTLGRHAEIDDVTARRFFEQFSADFGKDGGGDGQLYGYR